MKTCGLLGGLSWASSQDYYRLMNEAIGRELGGLHSAKIVLHSLDLHDYAEMASRGDFGGITELVKSTAIAMQKGGADYLVICSNTAHVAAPELEKCLPSLPFLHIADCTARIIKVIHQQADRINKITKISSNIMEEPSRR